MSTDLDVQIRLMLEQRRGDWHSIAKDAGVSHSWISQFVRDQIPNPGFRTLQKLYIHLKPRRGGKACKPVVEVRHV